MNACSCSRRRMTLETISACLDLVLAMAKDIVQERYTTHTYQQVGCVNLLVTKTLAAL